MNRLILIEGIPGSGKTTYAMRLENYFNENGQTAKCYQEGDRHPADLAWCAVLSASEYDAIVSGNPLYAEKIKNCSYSENGSFIIPYLELGIKGEHKDLWDYFESKEIFNGRYSLEDFLEVNLKRWESFANKETSKNEIIIFESVFFQNPINEIILFHDYTYDLVIEYVSRIQRKVAGLSPLLIYLDQRDIKKTITEVASKRKSKQEGFPDWLDSVIKYIMGTPFGFKCKYSGFDCFIEFLEIRKTIETKLYNDLEINKLFISDSSHDYEKGFKKIISFLDKF